MSKTDIYQQITDRIVSKLEQGVIPWKKPFTTLNKSYPKNFVSKKVYNGANFFLTLLEGRNTPYWLTYNQAKQLGGNVKKGESGIPIVYFQFIEKTNDKGELYSYPIVKHSTVFNLEQVEGIVNPFEAEMENLIVKSTFNKIEECERLIEMFNVKVPPVKHSLMENAYYSPMQDFICMPLKERFKEEQFYYSTLFHEIAHSTGHESRLARQGIVKPNKKGSPEYAREELVAELSASFICAEAGIVKETEENTTAYIQSWLNALKNDNKIVYDAMRDSFKVLEHLQILNKAA